MSGGSEERGTPALGKNARQMYVFILLGTRSHYLVHACAAIGTVLSISVGVGILSLSLPAMAMCGNPLPDWPGEKSDAVKRADQPEQVALNTHTQPASTSSCRPK